MSALKCGRDELLGRIEGLFEERKRFEKQIKALQRGEAAGQLDTLLKNVHEVGNTGYRLVTAQVSTSSADELRIMGDKLREKLKSGVGVLASIQDEKVQFLCVVTDDLIKQGIKAGDIVREVAMVAGGSGGGRPHQAMAGAKEVEKVDEALARVEEVLIEKTGKKG